MSPVFACRVPASDTRITRSLNSGTLALIALCACTPIRAADVVSTAASPLAQPKSPSQVGLPAAAIQAAIPADNPQTPEKIALGQRLFFDARLSADGTVACSTCHEPTRAFTDGKPVSTGIGGRLGQRNAPTILDALFETTQFWDGRVATLEQQAGLPIVNSVEMGQPSLDAAVAKLSAIPEYRHGFRSAFGSAPDARNLVEAIAAYERTQLAYDSPFDHYAAGERDAIDVPARRGWELFNARARCNKCHALSENQRDTTNFTDLNPFEDAQNVHVVERLTRVDDDTILYQFTVEDPGMWTKPWSGEVPIKKIEGQLYEYACHEANYGLANTLRGARVADAEAAKKAAK